MAYLNTMSININNSTSLGRDTRHSVVLKTEVSMHLSKRYLSHQLIS